MLERAMPGFLGHTTGNAIVLVGTTAVMWSQNWSIADIVAVDSGIAVATLILSPDMDLFTSKPMDDWGILRYFWWPYSKLVKHRDRLHTPLLGTFVRWLYMMVILSIAIVPVSILLRRVGFKMTFQGDAEDIAWYLGYLLDAFIGANLADAMHFVLDMTTTGFKRGLGHHHHRERYPMKSERRQGYAGEENWDFGREQRHEHE
jgi:uncharacterized metal-binding protein